MQTDAFENRHIGPNKQEQKKILKTIGVDSMSHLLGFQKYYVVLLQG